MSDASIALLSPTLAIAWGAMVGFILWVSGAGRTPWHTIRWTLAGMSLFLAYAFLQAKTGDGFDRLDIGGFWVFFSIGVSVLATWLSVRKAQSIDDLGFRAMIENQKLQREWIKEADALKGSNK